MRWVGSRANLSSCPAAGLQWTLPRGPPALTGPPASWVLLFSGLLKVVTLAFGTPSGSQLLTQAWALPSAWSLD